jgi:hypothetical protein
MIGLIRGVLIKLLLLMLTGFVVLSLIDGVIRSVTRFYWWMHP